MPKATRKKPVITDEIATVEKDITQYYLGKVLINPDTVLSSEARGEGLKLYEDLERDDRVFSEMQKRKLAVVGKEWTIEPASDDAEDIKIAEFVEQNFKEIKFDRACEELLDGILKGFKPAEIMWDYSEGDIWIKEFRGRDPRRFTFDKQNQLRLLTWGNMIEGEEIPERKFQLFRFGEKNNNPFGTGLGNKLYWPVWFKKNGVKFEAVFLEKFGQPTPWGKYPSGTIKEQQDKLLDAIKSMQTDVGIITPDNMEVELLEAARASSVNAYESWRTYWNTAITLVILGQTATTEGTPGKLGAETERSEVRQEYVKADADRLSEWLNEQSIKWLVDYNFPKKSSSPSGGGRGGGGYPKFWKRTDPEQDLKPLAERDRILIKEIGVPTPVSYIRDTYGIPEPEEGEELITPPQSAIGSLSFGELEVGGTCGRGKKNLPQAKRSFCLKRSAPLTFAESEDAWIEAYLKKISPSLKNVKASATEEIRSYLRKQKSPPSEDEFVEALQGILGNSYKKIDQTAITDAVADAYRNYKLTEKVVETVVGFGGADVRAVNFLANVDRFYLSRFLQNPDAQAATMDFLKTRFLEGGEGLFGAGDPKIWKEFSNALSQHMTDLEGYQVRRIIETGVQRTRNWAHISQLSEAGIAEIEIVEPTMECPFCASMDGKIIQVDIAFNRMSKQAAMTPEEYEEELRNNPPSLDSIEDFVDQGLLPPYHPHCRGRIIKRIKS